MWQCNGETAVKNAEISNIFVDFLSPVLYTHPKPTKVKFWENLPKPDLGSAPDSRLYLHSHLSSAGSPLSDSLDSRLSSGPVLDVTR